jgi:hypothetical protein
MKKIIPLLAATLILLQAYAGTGIYFFNGKVYIVDKGNAHAIANVNEPVPAGASVRLAENSEAILRNSDGRFAILKKAGDYSPENIKSEFEAQKGKDLVQSMAGFLGAELAAKHVDIRKMSESYMRQKGGVTRQGSTYPLMVWPPYGSVSDTNHITFVWNAMKGIKKYEFVVYGSEDPNTPVQLSKSLESDTSMDVNFSDFGIDKDAYFSWVAYPEGDPNYTRYTFKITTAANIKKIEKEIAGIAAKEATEENKLLVTAIAYEKEGLINRADKTYSDLLKKYNTSVNEQLVALFKIRNNLIEGM